MNQVMINAVELDMLMQEIKDLKADNFKLKMLLANERKNEERADTLKEVLRAIQEERYATAEVMLKEVTK
jgi:hypothetical protein